MADISYNQMETLLANLVRNLDNSESSRGNRSKLDKIISSLDRVRDEMESTRDAISDSARPAFDYNRLSASILSGIRASNAPGNNTSSRQRRDNRRQASPTRDTTLNNRRPNSMLSQLSQQPSRSGRNGPNRRATGLDGLVSSAMSASSSLEKLTVAGQIARRVFSTAQAELGERATAYRTMMANGETFGGDILQMSRVANSAGMTLSNFTNAIASSSQGLKLLGPEAFADTVYQVKLINSQFGDLGLTTQQTGAMLSEYTERLRTTGKLQGATASSVASGFRNVVQSSISLASAVGTSSEKIISASNAIANETTNRALLHLVSGQGGQNITQYLGSIVSSMGGGQDAYRVANAMMQSSQGINTDETARVAQMLGPAYERGVEQIRQLGAANAAVSSETMARMGQSWLGSAQQFLGSQDVRSRAVQGDQGQQWLGTYNSIMDARINPDRAADTTRGLERQTPLTNGALNADSARESLAAARESAATAGLTTIQNTLGESLRAYNTAVIQGTHSFTNMMNAMSQNPITRGIDGVGGSIISGLSNMLGPIGLFTAALTGFAAIKLSTIAQSLRTSMEVASEGLDAIRRGRGGRRSGTVLDRLSRNAEDLSDLRGGGRRGLLERMGRSSRLRRLRQLRGAGNIGRLGRVGSLLRNGASGIRGLAAGGEALGGLAGVGAIAAPVLTGLGSVGLGAYWNHESTRDYREGRITSSQNNINHDSNYGMMGGALTGAATGAAIGALLGPIGLAAGGVIGGAIGGFTGYEAGHGIGTWANGTTPNTPQNPLSTPAQSPVNDVPNPATPDTNALLQQLINQLSSVNSTLSENEDMLSRVLQSIDRNTGDTVRQLKRAGNSL